MRRKFTGAEVLVALLLVLLVGLGSCRKPPRGDPAPVPNLTYEDLAAINAKLNALDSTVKALNLKGDTLRKWLAATDGPEINAPSTDGLTTWLIELKKTLLTHMGQRIDQGAHSGAGHQHADPPPPPPW